MSFKKSTGLYGWLILFFFLSNHLISQPNADVGKTLFRNNCAQCHAKDMKTNLTGPALMGSEERWATYPREDLYRWIRNSQALIAEGHPRAVELWDEWKPTQMQAFADLTDEDIESILLYVDAQVNAPLVNGTDNGVVDTPKQQNMLLYWLLLGVLLLLAYVLWRVIVGLNNLEQQGQEREYMRPTIWESMRSKKFISFALFFLVLLGGYTTVTRAISLGRQQNYEPDQPIKFSHETHAGIHQIDCQYCHDGARRSKHAIIPATNTCMNCHRAITTGSKYGATEISKIYASIGFDPNTNKYIDNYDEMEQEDIKQIFKKWFATNYIADQGQEKFIEQGEEVINTQWQEIVNSLTNDQKKRVQGPIEWIRIHNLPDHVFFNHEQHVKIAGLECQSCHGKVEEMDVLKQHSTLSMGWCINCHRQTAIDFENNPYYTDSYEKYHQELIDGTIDKVTVEDIGGLDCQKCHY